MLTDHGAANDSAAPRVRSAAGVAFAMAAACPVHALTACTHETGAVPAREEIVGDADKAGVASTVAPRPLAHLDRCGRVLTGDALFCQRTLCAQVRDGDGDYLPIVKENQPALLRDIVTLFASRADKDVTLGEDRSLIRTGNGPSVMAILRDTVVSALYRAGCRTIAERLRYYSGHPKEVLALLGIPLTENAYALSVGTTSLLDCRSHWEFGQSESAIISVTDASGMCIPSSEPPVSSSRAQR